jgi:hypothetical protein
MTLSTPGLLVSDLEEGIRDCQPLYDEQMDSMIMFFGSQGDEEGELELPDGVAANLPPFITIVHEVHYVNASDQEVTVFSDVNGYTIPQSQVEEGIWGGQVRDETIEIPAAGTATEWSRCVFNVDVQVLFLASHTHRLGDTFSVKPFDGVTVGEELYLNTDLHYPQIEQYSPPLIVPAGEGFEWTCTWDNPHDFPISYGPTADDEMCNLSIVHTPQDMSAQCEVVETSDGVIWTP